MRPVSVSAMVGLSAAALAGIGLTLLHHLDATAMVLLWHGGSVLLATLVHASGDNARWSRWG